MRKYIICFLAFFLTILTPISGLASSEKDLNEKIDSARGKVIEVIKDAQLKEKNNPDLSLETQVVKVKVLSGKFKGEEFVIENNLSGNPSYDIKVKKGDEVLLSIEDSKNDAPKISISDYIRDKYLIILLVIFVALLIIIGGLKGLKSVITLSITAVIIMFFMLPMILKGYNPIWVAIVSATLITLITFFIIGGFNVKSFSAIVGTVGGVVCAGVLAYIVGSLVKLTGLNSEEAGMLMFIPQKISFDFRGLLFSGIIIGTLGAVMDIGMSIASAMYELKVLNPDISPRELIKSGLNIGKDVMGTMSNTLILAYTGSSIPLLLLFMSYDTSLSKILNLDLMATEIVRALVGSIGLIIAIPITAFSTGFILKLESKKLESKEN
ncbi:YibE/F family protein [Gottschalkia purinilytica]|uniref:YibE/F family protein n=1 Tax=Gottschalkia purinilytica TaxID=1503 RepID=A0A0L0WEV8_GOTPU|nr:YibE/F family protein [Gottschalkia purinilytica]KNF10004.1 YibE/F family protein [Gottschalkia purinilytica]